MHTHASSVLIITVLRIQLVSDTGSSSRGISLLDVLGRDSGLNAKRLSEAAGARSCTDPHVQPRP